MYANPNAQHISIFHVSACSATLRLEKC